jgi:hypothetical protein
LVHVGASNVKTGAGTVRGRAAELTGNTEPIVTKLGALLKETHGKRGRVARFNLLTIDNIGKRYFFRGDG